MRTRARVAAVVCQRTRALVLGLQLDHRREERRLRAAQVVAAAAVRNVPVAIDEPGEIFDHVGHEIVAAAGLQTHHREVGIPVVHLAKAPAGHDVAGREPKLRTRAASNLAARASARATACRCARGFLRAARSGIRWPRRRGSRSSRRRNRAAKIRRDPCSASYLRMISPGADFATASANVLLSAKILSVCTRWNSAPYNCDGGSGAASRAARNAAAQRELQRRRSRR